MSPRRTIGLPAYLWALMIAVTLVGVVIGAVLFSASFRAHVSVTSTTPGLSVFDTDGVTVLATSAQADATTLEFGDLPAGTETRRQLWIEHSQSESAPLFYIWVLCDGCTAPRQSFSATMLDGSPLPSGVSASLSLRRECAFNGGSDVYGLCSIPFSKGQRGDFDVVLRISSTVSPGELTFRMTVSAFDIPCTTVGAGTACAGQ